MRIIFSFILSLFIMSPVFATTRLDSLLMELDKIMEKEYTIPKENYLEKLKTQFRNQNLLIEDRYLICQNLAKEYETFVCDSAITYSNTAVALAEETGNKNWINDSKIQLARSEARAGMFDKAIKILNTIKRDELMKHQLVDYYRTYCDSYVYWLEYQDGYDIGELVRQRETYQDSLLQAVEPNTFEYAVNYGIRYIETKDFKNAERVLFFNFDKVRPDTQEYALITSILAYYYEQKGDREKQKEYLAMSAIADVKVPIKENLSLRSLAVLLFGDNDVNRANRYIKKSLDDANFYNARLRNIQTAKLLPIIDKAYQLDREAQENKLKLLLVVVSILSVILLIVIAFVVLQMKRLSKAKQYIEEMNSRLNELNRVLKETNSKQQQTNISLAEANHIKEQFISNFLEICTEYIEKLEAFKVTVSRKIKSGQTADLIKLTSKSDNSVQEQKELYANFDKAFLNIYPGFIEEFNNLLRPEERYPENKDHSLNQELRIFALIRLGIKDTNKIATFLNYTPRTVYNYRSKIKAKALNTNEDLEDTVKYICSDKT